METFLIPVLDDNYVFVLRNESTRETVVIDPALAKPVEEFLHNKGWGLNEIWITHHHYDHVDGIQDLKRTYSTKVRCHEKDKSRIPGFDITHDDGDSFQFANTDVFVKSLDGHTLGHICYHLPHEKILFSGDTIFAMGCGRLFEGTAEQMFESLSWIASLDKETHIYCSHEYTLANAEFAVSLFPENKKLRVRLDQVKKLRLKKAPTIPTTVELELKTNPFLLAQTAEEFAHFRNLKDQF